MDALKDYVIALTAAALICGILLSLVPDGSLRKLLQLVCGVFLTVTALTPLTRLTWPDISGFLAPYNSQGESIAAMGQSMGQKERLGRIRDALEAYILDKAAALNCPVTLELSLDDTGVPLCVRLEGEYTLFQKQQLMTIITNDLGIPGEDQQWTGKTENES